MRSTDSKKFSVFCSQSYQQGLVDSTKKSLVYRGLQRNLKCWMSFLLRCEKFHAPFGVTYAHRLGGKRKIVSMARRQDQLIDNKGKIALEFAREQI